MFPKVVVKDDSKTNDVKDDVKRNVVEIDVWPQFTNDQLFSARQHMLEWIRMQASKLGFDIVIGRSGNGTSRRQAFVTMTCERSGSYVQKTRKLKRDDTGSRKCECPFKLRGYGKVDDTCWFNVISGIHNHELETKLQGHPIVCRLKPEEKEIISDMSIIKVAARNILADLKRKRPQSVSNIKQVYNECYQRNMAKRDNGSEIQQLLKLLDDNHYVSRYRLCDDKVSVRDIFWAHPERIKLFNTFPTVLIIDSTYKTNKYRLPLLEIVGVNSTEKTFSVGFTFLEYEKEDNVAWALDICKTLLKDPKKYVIVTDRDNALMNAVGNVFPTSYALLCRYHITKNVRSRLKPAVGTKEIKGEDESMVKSSVMLQKIMDAWTNILNSSTEELYAENVVYLRSLCVKYPNFLKYVESTILDQVKEKFFCAWTDHVRYLGYTTTNRVEYAHSG